MKALSALPSPAAGLLKRTRRRGAVAVRLAAVGLLAAVATSVTSEAQWSPDPRRNLAVCTASSTNDVVTCPDGGGGMIAAWVDGRGGIWAQRVTVSGFPAWPSGGVQINANAGGPALVSDGSGGAIVAGLVHGGASGLNIVAHRITGGGTVSWGPVPLCTANGAQTHPNICTDGAGGAIVTWDDSRTTTGRLFARRVSAAGAAMWAVNGVELCSTGCSNVTGGIYRPSTPQVLPDGSGGAMVVWAAGTGLSAQRIGAATGARMWGTNGTTVTTIGGVPAIAPDGSGGLIVVWADTRAGFPTMQLFAQRITSAGAAAWTVNGVLLRTDPNGSMSQVFPVAVSDGLGGAIALWSENQSGVSTWGLFARRITPAGVPQWSASGTALVSTSLSEVPNSITAQSDGQGGVVACWLDRRSFIYDLYAQRVNGAGAAQWGVNGVLVSGNAATQDLPAALTVTNGNSIFTWNDFRPGGGIYHVYCQLVRGSGLLGTPRWR